MKSEQFWTWFDTFAAPKLGTSEVFPRERTFRKMFEHLDSFDRPVHIIETGCVEDPDNWIGNGCSTILFQKYIETHPACTARSVEIIPEKVEVAKKLCPNVYMHCGDSVAFLGDRDLWDHPVDLLYLDASHHDWIREAPSQVHHYRELMAALPQMHARTLVVVDDSVISADDYPQAKVIGKGGLVAQFALEVGADFEFCDYQVGFTNLTNDAPRDMDQVEGLIARARDHAEANRSIAADRLYRLVMISTPPPWNGRARIARGEACANFARNALHMKKYGVAIDWYRSALDADPRASDYRVEMVRALCGLGALNVAKHEAELAAKIEPENPAVWSCLGGVEADLMNAEACTAAYDRQLGEAVKLDDPAAISAALLNRVTIAVDTEDYELARTLCYRLIELEVRKGDAYHVLAMMEYRQANHERSIELFDKALAEGASNQPIVHWNKSLPLHSIGRYKEGWEEHYEGGIKEVTVQAIYVPHHRFARPEWTGEASIMLDPILKEEERPTVIHVHTEAGHGDNIAILRYLPLLAGNGYKVRYECDPSLIDLVKDSMPQIEVMPRALDYPGALGLKPFDYHIPIGDLPHAFGTDIDTVPWFGPYLKADPDLTSLYGQHLTGIKGRKIGLCWSSGIRRNLNIWMERYGSMKSMHFRDVERLTHDSGPDEFISLQVGDGRAEGLPGFVRDVLPEKPTWAETAALVANLDLVITVDTAIAHLAGAMGKPVWVLMQRNGASWHFLCHRPGASWNTSSPWYPTARVFRQHDFDKLDWRGAVDDVAIALRELRESEDGDGELKRHGDPRH